MTHTCQICHRSQLSLVEGVLEEHGSDTENSDFYPCPASGTDRYVREEGRETPRYPEEQLRYEVIMVIAQKMDDYRAALTAEQARSRALREALGHDTSWPVADVLDKLADAARILLVEKDYDGHRHEEIQTCMLRAKDDASAIRRALAAYDAEVPLSGSSPRPEEPTIKPLKEERSMTPPAEKPQSVDGPSPLTTPTADVPPCDDGALLDWLESKGKYFNPGRHIHGYEQITRDSIRAAMPTEARQPGTERE